MICELEDVSKVEKMFSDFCDAGVTACLQKVMGKIFVTDPYAPRSAMAFIGCFAFFAGEPDRELLLNKPGGFVIMVPQNDKWAELIESVFQVRKRVRYAIKKGAGFDREKLAAMVNALPDGYEIRKIDRGLYDRCLAEPEFHDFVSNFGSKERFLELGRGAVVLKSGISVAGASS